MGEKNAQKLRGEFNFQLIFSQFYCWKDTKKQSDLITFDPAESLELGHFLTFEKSYHSQMFCNNLIFNIVFT